VLGVHHVVRAAVGLPRDDGHLGDGGLAERIQELGAVTDDASVLLGHTGQEARDVLEHHQRDVEGITEPDEAGALVRRIDVENAGQDRRLVCDDAYGPATEMGEAHQDVPGEPGVDLIERPVVHHVPYDIVHVIRMIGVIRNDLE
jgi:hypothetical protein